MFGQVETIAEDVPVAVGSKVQIEQRLDKDSCDFGRLAEKYWTLLYGIAYDILCDCEDTEDVVQEALLKAFEAYCGYTEERRSVLNVQAWLCRIVQNTALNLDRHKRKLNFLSLDDSEHSNYLDIPDTRYETPEMAIMREEVYRIVHNLVRDLSPLLRLFLWCRFMRGYKYDEIAVLLGNGRGLGKVSIGTLRVQMYRGVGVIREMLALYGISLNDLEDWGEWSAAFESPVFISRAARQQCQGFYYNDCDLPDYLSMLIVGK